MNMKKLLVISLVLVMVLALGATIASAEDSGIILTADDGANGDFFGHTVTCPQTAYHLKC